MSADTPRDCTTSTPSALPGALTKKRTWSAASDRRLLGSVVTQCAKSFFIRSSAAAARGTSPFSKTGPSTDMVVLLGAAFGPGVFVLLGAAFGPGVFVLLGAARPASAPASDGSGGGVSYGPGGETSSGDKHRISPV